MSRGSFLSVLLAASLGAQLPATSEGPPPLYSFGLAFDEGRQRLVLFGGYSRGTYSGDTWEWDGQRWVLASQSGPQGRNAPRMVFDSRRGTVVMFGGDIRSGALGDTWTWDGRAWTQVASSGPAARTLHSMAFDAHRQRVVLFGGRAGPVYFTDTWELDGHAWKKVADTGPPPRMMHAMAYDPVRRASVIIGGNTAVEQPNESDVLGDAWIWDGARWRALEGSPGKRDHTWATFDPVNDAVLVVGGTRLPEGTLADAFWWKGGHQWIPQNVTALGARAGHAMATDMRNRRVFLYGCFGGNATSPELWEYSATGWKRLWSRQP